MSNLETSVFVATRKDKRLTRGQWWDIVTTVLIGIITFCVLSYPVVSTVSENLHQRNVSERYRDATNPATTNIELQKELDRAEQWVKEHPNIQARDPWKYEAGEDGTYDSYMSVLDKVKVENNEEGNSVMSTVRIPKLGLDMPVYHGTSDKTLSEALGHLYGTALPIGVPGGRPVITGHTGLRDRIMLDKLTDMEIGDVFYVTTYGMDMKYQVRDIKVIEPSNVEALDPVEGKDLVTLLTCTPYGINSHRLLVTGERVPMDDSNSSMQDNMGNPVIWWMWALFVLAILVLIVMIVWVTRRVRQYRKANIKKAQEAFLNAQNDEEGK